MKKPYIFFDFGGTLTTKEQAMADITRDEDFYQRLRQLFLKEDVYRTIGDTRVVDDLGRFTEALLAWIFEEKKRRAVSELEKDSAQMWAEIFCVPRQDPETPFSMAAEEASIILETYQVGRIARPEAHDAMADLQQKGYGLGVISNMNTRTRVHRQLDEYGLTHWFSPIVISSHIGCRKPHPMIFHYAASLAGVPMSECWYVGDTISRDILGARRSGCAGVVRITGSKDTVDQKYLDSYSSRHFTSDATIDSLLDLDTVITAAHQYRNPRFAEGVEAVILAPGLALKNTGPLRPVLRALKQSGYYLGLAGNSPSSLLDLLSECEQRHIGDCWDAVHTDNTDPAAELFVAAAEQMQCAPTAVMLISDDEQELAMAETVSMQIFDARSREISELESDLNGHSVIQ